jgi:hypothetical protein
MSAQLFTAAERPDLWERAYDQIVGVWPTYNEQGDVLGRHWSRLDEDYADFQLVLYDEERNQALAHGHTIPLRWDGTVEGLPDGIDEAMERAVRLFDEGGQPNTLSALAIEIPPQRQGGGLARTMIGGMREIASARDFGNLIAPLRPTWKERYPLTPIERYASWTRPDGLPFDPWIRLHVRLGAEITKPLPRSLHITGMLPNGRNGSTSRSPRAARTSSPTRSHRSRSTARPTAASTGSRMSGFATA